MVVAAGATNLYFQRDTKVYIKQGDNIWQIPVNSGYAFTQSTNTSQVTLNQAADANGNTRRGSRVFTDSYAPAQWSFDTYIRPYKDGQATPNHRAVEQALWANFVSKGVYDPATNSWSQGATPSSTDLTIDFDASNSITLGQFQLYFVLGGDSASDANYQADGDTTIFKLDKAVINQAAINFQVQGIGMISWSGMGTTLQQIGSFDASGAIVDGTNQTDNFIRNKLTALGIVSSISGSEVAYQIILTGGSMTISNNIQFLIPQTIGVVNTPIAHITGSRSVSGNFTCYLDQKTNGSLDLLEDIHDARTVVTNQFALDFFIGGKASGDAPIGPGLQVKMQQCHLQIPQVNVDDVISVDVNFRALPSTISGTDQITKVVYVAQ